MIAIAGWGCGVGDPEAPAEGEVSQGLITPTGGPCPQFACGANSPLIDKDGFHEFNLFGESRSPDETMPNDARFTLQAVNHRAQIIDRKGASYDLYVSERRFVGLRCTNWSCIELRGSDLVGATIPVRRGRARYEITIETVRPIAYFVDPRGAPSELEAYTLLWSARGGATTNLCDNITVLSDAIDAHGGGTDGEYAAQELMGMQVFESVVFEGDRVDAVHRTMSPGADDNWFNIGCAGATLSKLVLTRNTIHSQLAGTTRAWEQRQATLKMMSADYCGTGTAFTVAGQRMVWRGDQMADFYTPPQKILEARWNETGAVCLGEPRMQHPTSALGATTFKAVWKLIDQECPQKFKTPCADLDPYNFAGEDRVSGNPILPVP